MARNAESDDSNKPTVHITEWQERILRSQHRTCSLRYMGQLCGRSRQWAAIALDTLKLKTPRQEARMRKDLL